VINAQGSTAIQVISPSDSATSSDSNCPITWNLKNSDDTAYAGTFLTHSNGAISYDP